MLFLTLGAFLTTAFGGKSAPAQPPEGDSAPPAARGTPQASSPQPSAAEAGESGAMAPPVLIASLYILVLAGFVGFEVIGGVSPLLHTPLMSVTNAISAISLVGSLVIAGSKDYPGTLSRMLGLLAVTAAMINVVGGFMITDRMLRMFKLKETRA
jgi:NAD(P) transhydrogenase subunit alpha